MSTHATHSSRRRAFTLIELIGVLAIIAIMASILAPNALRSMDRAAVRAEDESTRRLGEQLQLYLKQQIRRYPTTPTAWLPTSGPRPQDGTWLDSIGTYSDVPRAEIEWNSRGVRRMLVYDPASNAPYSHRRAVLLSSMRSGCALPASVQAAATSFDTIWNNRDEEVPFLLGWAGWNRVVLANGTVRSTDGEYLVVERINFVPTYLSDAVTYTVTLNNASQSSGVGGGSSNAGGSSGGNNAGANGNGNGNANGNGNGNGGNSSGNGGSGGGASAGVSASFRIYWSDGSNTGPLTLAPGVSTSRNDVRSGDRIELYDSSGSLNYTYIVSTENRTLEFDGVQWRAR